MPNPPREGGGQMTWSSSWDDPCAGHTCDGCWICQSGTCCRGSDSGTSRVIGVSYSPTPAKTATDIWREAVEADVSGIESERQQRLAGVYQDYLAKYGRPILDRPRSIRTVPSEQAETAWSPVFEQTTSSTIRGGTFPALPRGGDRNVLSPPTTKTKEVDSVIIINRQLR